MMDRRTFLAFVPPALGLNRAIAGDHVSVIDTHLHCFAGNRDSRFPYHADGPYQPADAATPEHLLKCMSDADVDRAVVVHPEPYQDDHRYLEYCLSQGKGKLKGTCLFFPDRPNAIAKLRELAGKVRLVAARIHAYNPERLPPFEKPELAAYWKVVGALGLAVQLHFEPRYAPGFEPLIREHSDVPVLIDHLGRPMQGTEKEYATVLAWSKYKHVTVKLSSVPDRGKYPHRDPAKIVKRLTETFGPDRLMYGGGYDAKATGASYRAERERVGEFLTHLSPGERARIFGGTASRLFKFS